MNRRRLFRHTALLLGALLLQRVEAHNALIATYAFQQSGTQNWLLTISLPLASLHEALLKQHTEDELVTDGKYNESLAVDYLLNHSIVRANDEQPIEFELLKARIGNHQSDFIFDLVNPPAAIKSLHFTIDAMSENAGHVNLVRVKQPLFKKKVILQFANQYQGRIQLPSSL